MSRTPVKFITMAILSVLLFTGLKKNDIPEDFFTRLDALNKSALKLGDSVRGKLGDMQLEAYNDRMISDHRVISKTLDDTARLLEMELKGKADDVSLKTTKGQALSEKYLKEVTDIHQKTLAILKEEISALEKETLMKEFSKSIRDRISTLVKNAHALKNNPD